MKLSLKAGFSQLEPSPKEIRASKACITNERRVLDLTNKITDLEYEVKREKT